MTTLNVITSASGAVGTIYCAAAVAKLISGPGPLENFLASASMSQTLRVPVSRMMPYAELIIGTAAIFWPGTWTASSAFFVAIGFLATLLWARRRGVKEPCRCFGVIDAGVGSTPVPLIRAMVLAACCAATLSISVVTGRLSSTLSMPSSAIGILIGCAFIAIVALGSKVWGLHTLQAEMIAERVTLDGGHQ